MKKRFLAILLSISMIAALPSSLGKNEMKASAADRQLNIVVRFGTTETTQYGVPNAFITRFENISNKVSAMYKERFGLTVKFTKPETNFVVSSPGDECRAGTTNFDSLCKHATTSACANEGPYHHTNCAYNYAMLFPRPRPYVNGLEMFITAYRICNVSNSGVHQGNILGMTYHFTKTMIVRDYDYVMNEDVENWLGNSQDIDHVSKTLAHEIGHLYGVADHSDLSYGIERDKCIWGYRKSDDDVVSELKMCNACQNVIFSNLDLYNFQ